MKRLIRFVAILLVVSVMTLMSIQIIEASDSKRWVGEVYTPSPVVNTVEALQEPEPVPVAVTEPIPEPVVAEPIPEIVYTSLPKGTCAEWIAAAGISDVANANELIRRESGCNPYAVNPSSGACGVAQELPCGKSGCTIGDGVCQVSWMDKYVSSRYGSWASAIAWHNSHNWY